MRPRLVWAVLLTVFLMAVGLALVPSEPRCTPERVESLRSGLAYTRGVLAGVQGTDAAREARARVNIAATKAAIERCGA